MANPSTTGPSGIGSEVLRRVQFNGISNTTTPILTVGTDMIITVLMISIIDVAGATGKTCGIYITPDGSGTCYLLNDEPLSAGATFVWNDRFVITETDVLNVKSSSTNHDIYCSYIEQEFA
jgi:hypothetical protein